MSVCMEELCRKDVINVENGSRTGYVCDMEIDTGTGCVTALIVVKNDSSFSLRRPVKCKVMWSDIVVIGKETVLVRNQLEENECRGENRRIFDKFFR